jgi:integrase
MRSYAPPRAGYYLVYDEDVRRLAVAVHASGKKAWKFIYHHKGKTRWLTLGEMSVDAARKRGYELSDQVAKGRDPEADAIEEKRAGSFDQLVERYFAEYAEANKRSHRQTRYLLSKYVPARFNSMKVTEIGRADVKAVLGPIAAKTAPLAGQVQAAMSAVFQWGIEEALVITSNPCRQIKRTRAVKRERILSNDELKNFYLAFGALSQRWDNALSLRRDNVGVALKVLLFTGQRPGEVAAMNHSQIRDGWWEMDGEPKGLWPGTKNKMRHRVWLPRVVQDCLTHVGKTDRLTHMSKTDGCLTSVGKTDGQVFSDNPRQLLVDMRHAMIKICKALGVERAVPHDLRRTHGSTITRLLGFGGRAAMNRIQNHIEGGIAGVYDRYGYEQETKDVMERVAAEMMRIAEGTEPFMMNGLQIDPRDLENPDVR